jgi:hypothetical protein
MAVDVAGDIAATMFARRGVGCIWQDVHVLVLRDGQWAYVGGGSANAGDDALSDRPTVLRGDLIPGADPMPSSDPQIMRGNGHGGVRDRGDGSEARPGGGRWISYGIARVTARVSSVEISDRRLLVPWHGRVLLAWAEAQSPRAIAHDEHDRAVGELLL